MRCSYVHHEKVYASSKKVMTYYSRVLDEFLTEILFSIFNYRILSLDSTHFPKNLI